MTLRSWIALASMALIACGPSGPVLEDRDSGSEHDAGTTADAGMDTDAGSTPDGGSSEPDSGTDAGTDAGPPPPACIEGTPPADPAIGAWDPSFSMPGVGGTAPTDLLALAAAPDGSVYLGGGFSHAGSIPANNVVKWTPSSGWHTMGAGIDGTVWAIAVHPSGSPVYAAAQMHDSGETAVLSFDGTSWSELARAGSGLIADMAVGSDGSLYVAGGFEGIGGDATLSSFAVWDGVTWSGLGDGNPSSSVSTVIVDSDGVCIGGRFDAVGTTSAQNVACWDGSGWVAFDFADPSYEVRVLARDPGGTLIAGGQFPGDSSSDGGGSIARWNGTAWETIGGGLFGAVGPGYVEGIAFVGSDMYVGGYFRAAGSAASPVLLHDVARWNGSAWDGVEGGAYREMGFGIIEQDVMRVVVADGLVYMGGMFTAAGGQSASHVAVWDGSYWSALRGPGQIDGGVNGNVNEIAARGSCGVYIGGSFNYAGAVAANNVAQWTGAGWSALGDGLEGTVNALVVAPDGTLYAGGDFIGPGFYYIAQWDGEQWSEVGGNVMQPVTALAVDEEGNLYVSGDFDVAGDVVASHIAMWDGTEWHALGDGLDKAASAIAIGPDGEVIAGGDFENAGGAPALHVARWDGTSWSAYGDGLAGFGAVSDIVVYDGQVVVSGNFDALPDGAKGVAVWDGESWTGLGGGLFSRYDFSPPYVQGITVVGTHLFAVGNFSMALGEDAVRAAYYDGTSWTGMGAGLNDVGEAILGTESGVWFGGTFTKADDTPSVAIAYWRFGG